MKFQTSHLDRTQYRSELGAQYQDGTLIHWQSPRGRKLHRYSPYLQLRIVLEQILVEQDRNLCAM